MKTAKPAAPGAATAAEQSSSRRSQPVRQTRVHGSRTGAASRTLVHRENAANAALGREQPIDIFPGIVHFADAITALPKELVRHFTLLREVDAKVHAPQHTLFRLVDNALSIPVSDPSRPDAPAASASASAAPESAPMSAQNSANGVVAPPGNPTALALALAAPSVEGSSHAVAHDPNALARRRAYREAANKVSEMLVSLEEKNHVISTANEALHKQLRRIDSIWPHLLEEFSDEAKWGSNTHWAYPENRVGRALTNAQAERSRREGAASLSAAAQHIADEVAARSDARKQAVAAKKDKSRTGAPPQPPPPQQQPQQQQQQQQQPQQQQQQQQQQLQPLQPVSTATPTRESDAEDHDAKLHRAEPGTNKKAATGAKSRKPAANTNTAVSESPTPIGLGIANATPTNGTPAPKRRKVEKPSNANNSTSTSNGVPMERAMSGVFGNSITKPKTSSPRGTPAPESQAKKRKALPTGGNQPKKRNGVANSPSMASSPVIGTFPDTVVKMVRNSPVPIPIPPTRAPAMARGKSAQSHGENGRPRPPTVAGNNNRPNGAFSATPETPVHTNGSRASTETRTLKDAPVLGGLTTPLTRVEPPKPEPAVLESTTAIPPPIIPPPSVRSRKNSVAAKTEEVGEATVAKKETTPSSTHGGAGSTTSSSTATTVTTKSGRASKPSTPALGSFPDSARASRPLRAADSVATTTAATPTTTGVPMTVKRSHKKGGSVALAAAQAAAAAAQAQHGPAPNGGAFKKDTAGGGKDDDEDPLYCYCQQPSYGEMIGCDANEACPYEWFHLDCVGLKAAPKTNVKWYCKECKKRLGIPEKKSNATG